MKIFKKMMPLALVLSMVFSSFTPVLAEVTETQNITEPGVGNTEVFYTQESSFGVTIPKKITLDSNKESTYTVTVNGDISSDEQISVIPDETFLMKDQAVNGTLKADVTATVTQDKLVWLFNEFTTIGNGLVSAPDLTAGNWAGNFYFNINLSKGRYRVADVEVTATDSEGNNLNATASNITGEEKDALIAKLKETTVIAEEDEIAALVEVNSDNFDGIANTTFNVSEIAETGDKVVILHYNESTSEWEYIGTETVDENGLVNGDFTSYSPVLFVKVNSDNTYGPVESVINYTNVKQENISYDPKKFDKYSDPNSFKKVCIYYEIGNITYDFEQPVKIEKVMLVDMITGGGSGRSRVKLLCSNDNKNWTLLDYVDWSGKSQEVTLYGDNAETNYRYYRIRGERIQTSGVVWMKDIRFYIAN